MIVKNSILDSAPIIKSWPPTPEEFSTSACENCVPSDLYNLIALCSGRLNEDFLVSTQLPTLASADHAKILSICQDIVSLTHSGRRDTPKSLALGLTLRHITGSQHISKLLHKFGHCSSYDSVLRYETALAMKSLGQNDIIPADIKKGVSTILVWDNIDFCEETLTGSGTTHQTNGILIQNQSQSPLCDVTSDGDSMPAAKKSRKSRAKSFNPPPLEIPAFHLASKQGPQQFSEETSIMDLKFCKNQDDIKAAQHTDLSFCLSKENSSDPHKLPGWTGFNRKISTSLPTKSAIHYLPLIEASPTDMSTINAILERSVNIADLLELDHVVVIFDQAIYSKVQQIRWTNPVFMERLIVRLGEFHTCLSFLGILGKRFGSAGLRDLMIESGIVAQGSINGVITGHHYNRSIRAHKLLYESFERLRFREFLTSLTDESGESTKSLLNDIEGILCDQQQLNLTLRSPDWERLVAQYQTFIREQSETCPTFALWSSYIDMVQILLTFIRATRQSDWSLHLNAVRVMMPWYFAYDRVNYAR